MVDLAVTDPPISAPAPATAASDQPSENLIEVFLGADGRLQINASINKAGLEELRRILTAFETVLKR